MTYLDELEEIYLKQALLEDKLVDLHTWLVRLDDLKARHIPHSRPGVNLQYISYALDEVVGHVDKCLYKCVISFKKDGGDHD
jgi:hypothetical protein